MSRLEQSHFSEFPLPDSPVPEVSLPETNTSKDAFFQNIFLEEIFLGNRDSEMKKKKSNISIKKSTFYRCGFRMYRALERWLSLLILCNTTTQIAVVIKNFVNQSLNLASTTIAKLLRFIITEKGTSSMQASQGLSLLKTVVNL